MRRKNEAAETELSDAVGYPRAKPVQTQRVVGETPVLAPELFGGTGEKVVRDPFAVWVDGSRRGSFF